MFLLNYRATPHTTTGYPLSDLLFNHLIRTKLPQVVTVCDERKDEIVRQKDEQAKTNMKQNSDKKRRAQDSVIQMGEAQSPGLCNSDGRYSFAIRQKKHSKFSTRFDPHPFRVVRKKGTMITAARNGKFVT